MNLNWKQSVKNVGIGITLLGLTVTLKGIYQILSYTLASIIIVESLIILFENISTNKVWKKIVEQTGFFDATYIGLGLGLFKLGVTYANIGWEWFGVIVLLVSAILLGAGIGENFGKSYKTIVKQNWKFGALVGVVFIILGVVQMIISWNSIMKKAIINAPIPATFIVLGVIWICYAVLKEKKAKNSLISK
jgi:hypothetical protein